MEEAWEESVDASEALNDLLTTEAATARLAESEVYFIKAKSGAEIKSLAISIPVPDRTFK